MTTRLGSINLSRGRPPLAHASSLTGQNSTKAVGVFQAGMTGRRAFCIAYTPDAERHADIVLLKERLAGGGIIDLDACSQREMRLMGDADGFRRPNNAGVDFVVRAQVFVGWFGTPARARRVLEWLDDEGLLVHGRDRTRGRSNEWAQKQVMWPDGSRPRSISLYFPAGLADLDRVS